MKSILCVSGFWLCVCLLTSFTRSSPAVTNPAVIIGNCITDTTPVADGEERVFEAVEVEARYRGGDKAWLRFLENNLDPAVPARKKAPAGIYTVIIQFVVSKDGQLFDFKPITDHGYGMEEEVIRVLKLSPRWSPAVQFGRNVKAYRKQPVTFQVEEKRKRRKGD